MRPSEAIRLDEDSVEDGSTGVGNKNFRRGSGQIQIETEELELDPAMYSLSPKLVINERFLKRKAGTTAQTKIADQEGTIKVITPSNDSKSSRKNNSGY